MGGNGARSRTATVGGAGGGMGWSPQMMARIQAFQQQQQTAAQPPAQPGQATQPGRTTLDQFRQMGERDLMSYIDNLKKNVTMPPVAELPEYDTQRLTYDLGLNDKPRIVTDAELNKMSGPMLYRGVHSYKDKDTVLATAQAVANLTMYDEYSRIGAGIAGDGYYFSTSTSTANSYAGNGKNLQESAVMKMKIDTSKAKMVTYDHLKRMFARESGGVQWAFQHMSTVDDQWSTGYLGAYALKKGYNVIQRHEVGHYIVLDRSVMVMSNNLVHRV